MKVPVSRSKMSVGAQCTARALVGAWAEPELRDRWYSRRGDLPAINGEMESPTSVYPVEGWRLRIFFALALVAGCNGGSTPERADQGPNADAGDNARPDAGEQDFDIAPPSLTPCPEGWEERFDAELEVAICEPWPASSSVGRNCPPGWVPVADGEVAVCEPWPDSSPVQWACPDGWRRVVEDGAQTCDPFPEAGAARCGDHEAHFLGEPGCSIVGTTCPPGDFPEGLPADAEIIYVQAGFEGGDGSSPASPLGALQALRFDDLAPGTIVALAQGEYVGAVEPVGELILWGACPAETILTANDDVFRQGTLQLSTAGTSLTAKNLRIAGGTRLGALVDSASILRLDGVIIERNRRGGIFVENGGRLELERSVIRDVRSDLDRTGGVGLQVVGATASVRRVVFDRNRGVGVRSSQSTTRLFMEDVIVRGTEAVELDQSLGRGLSVQGESTAEVRRAAFIGNREVGVLAARETRLVLEDALILDTRSRASDQVAGYGLNVQQGAQVEARRVLLARNRDVGVFAMQSGTRLVLQDAVVRHTASQEASRRSGRGLNLQDGARVEVRRAMFSRNREYGIFATDEDTELVLEDAVVQDTQSREEDQTLGRGLGAELGAQVQARRVLLARNRNVGILVDDPNTRLTLEDAVVRDTQSQSLDQILGSGLEVQPGAQAEVRRAVFSRNRTTGVSISGQGSRLVLEDTVVRDTQSDESGRTRGLGLEARFGARAEVRRVFFLRNRVVGVLATSDGTQLVAEDLVIRDTQSQEADRVFGRGLEVGRGARAEVRRAVIERNRDIGILAGDLARIDLEDAVVGDTQSQESDQRLGIGLSLVGGTRAELRRVIFHRNTDVAVMADGAETHLRLEDAVVRDTRSREVDQFRGGGMVVQFGASCEVFRAKFFRNRHFGVSAFSATATLSQTIVSDVRRPLCVDLPEPCLAAAIGVVSAGEEARVVLDQARVAQAGQCGVFTMDAGQIDGSGVIIAENAVGACFDDPMEDPSRLGAEFINNGERIIFENLPPAPAPVDPVED